MPKKAKKAMEISAKPVLINGDQKRYLLWSRPSLYGKSIKRYFVTKAEAETEQARLLKELADGGKDSVHDDATLRKHREDAKRALALAGGKVTLEAAVSYWLSRTPEKNLQRTLKAAVEEFLESKTKDNEKPVRKSTLASYRKTLNPFAEDIGESGLASKVTEEEIKDWLNEDAWARPTRRFHCGNLKTFFRWSLVKGYVKIDESRNIIKPALDDEEEVEFLSVSDAIRLLVASESLFPECSPAVAISLFAGMRSSELRQVEWSEVSEDGKTILVTAAKAKTRSKRQITIRKNLAAWLAQKKERTGLIIPPGWREKWASIRKAAGFGEAKPWPRNGCRHSFASYYLADGGDEKECAKEMGNSPEIIFRHYRGLVRRQKDAKTFWSLTPASIDKKGKVIELAAVE